MSMLSCPCSLADPAGEKDKDSPLEGVLKNIIKNLDGKNRPSEEDLMDAWECAVGKRAASHSKPVAFKGAGLVVNVDGSSWLYELTTRKREILKSLGEKITAKKKIKDIRFRIGEVTVKRSG